MNDPAGQELQAWVGREEVQPDVLDPFPARGMAALLDRGPDGLREGDELPECWHWLYFKTATRQSELGPDGHARRGGFLPPIPLPRRMWAGGRFRFHAPLVLGERAERRSRILAVEEKSGGTGPLVRVTVLHTLSGARGVAVEEEQDLIYREAPRPDAPRPRTRPAPEDVQWRERFVPDPVILFRFSALTFNGHRIHYDHPYATREEGYPGLVVHGPLIALLLLEAAKRRTGLRPRSFQYRALSPLFDHRPFSLAGRTADAGGPTDLWAVDPDGAVATQATVEWEA